MMFTPHSGVQIRCDSCRFRCKTCGGKKSNGSSELCIRCAIKEKRRFIRSCQDCGAVLYCRNNKTKYCEACDKKHNPMACIDCGTPITRRHKRCNSCVAINRSLDPSCLRKGWLKYVHNGTRYRSTWEIAAAKIFEACGVNFEYERIDQETRTRPDFYIGAIDRYLEIHPDYHGVKKVIPHNCVLVKTLNHARASALGIALKMNPEAAKTYISNLSTMGKQGLERVSRDLVMYLRQAIEERS